MTSTSLPYFDFIIAMLEEQDPDFEKAFGTHVHFGYWKEPHLSSRTLSDFGKAAEQLTHLICKLAQIKENDCILDVGCGFGGTILTLNEIFRSLKLYGLNIDKRQIERAQALIQPIKSNKINFTVGNASNLPFPANSFDHVMAIECIFHFPSREQFFQEVHRVLRPGGRLIITDIIPSIFLNPWIEVQSWLFPNIGIYGRINWATGLLDYHILAKQTKLTVVLECDVTYNTLPTHECLEELSKLRQQYGDWLSGLLAANVSTASHIGLLKYYILGFQKNE